MDPIKVLTPNSAQAQVDIEAASDQFLPAACIRFVQDGGGQWIVGKEVLSDPTFETIWQLIITNTHEVDYIPFE